MAGPVSANQPETEAEPVPEGTEVWPDSWVEATFTDPEDGVAHLVTVKGFSPAHGGRSLVEFTGGGRRWVSRSDVKR